jgi:hypothetical protein
LFSSARLIWENQRGGKLSYVNVYFMEPSELGQRPQQALSALRACLEPMLGAPTVIDADHVARKVNLDWPGRSGFPRVHATEQLVMIFRDVFGQGRTESAGWQQVFTRLDACVPADADRPPR